ncbi:MAG TPA: LCP family protein [Anaerolineaceae bacterium]|nr:LCP family protein [Anaerolineaceae bacterium]
MKQFLRKLKAALPEKRKTRIVLGVLVALGIIGALVLGSFTNNFVAGMSILNLPGVPVLSESTPGTGQTPGAEGTPAVATLQPILETQEAWDGKSRVNVLIMGLDSRDLEETAPRTDSMILFTMDPVNLTAGMISIPRDLWVKIHGADYGKINTAYSIGEAYKLPGGGPALAAKTVEDLLGVPIQYYAQLDFEAFIKFVDHIDGVKINVPERIQLDVVGTKLSMWLDPGVVTLPGQWALAYVRARGTAGGDFDRAQRQQQVILAIRDRVLDFNMMPTLISKSGEIYADLSTGIRTNLAPDEVIKLGIKVLDIPRESIQQAVIDGKYVNFGRSPDGLEILRPIPDKIRELRDEIFYGVESSGTGSAQDVQARLQDEQARVSILNSSSSAGLAEKTGEYLKGQGLNIVGQSDSGYQVYTRVTLYGSKPYTLKYLVDFLKISSPGSIIYAYDPNATVDIVVELGDDWAGANALP